MQSDRCHWYVQHSVSLYDKRGGIKLIQPRVNTTRNGLKSFRYQGAKICNEHLKFVKNTEDLSEFKFKYRINEWPDPVCKCGSCELCKFNNIRTVFCHSLSMLYFIVSNIYIYANDLRIAYVFTCMHACMCVLLCLCTIRFICMYVYVYIDVSYSHLRLYIIIFSSS